MVQRARHRARRAGVHPGRHRVRLRLQQLGAGHRRGRRRDRLRRRRPGSATCSRPRPGAHPVRPQRHLRRHGAPRRRAWWPSSAAAAPSCADDRPPAPPPRPARARPRVGARRRGRAVHRARLRRHQHRRPRPPPRHRQVGDLPPRREQGRAARARPRPRARRPRGGRRAGARGWTARPSTGSRSCCAASVAVLVERLPYVTLLLRVRGNSEVERRGARPAAAHRPARSPTWCGRPSADGDLRPDIDPAVTARLLFGMVNSLTEWLQARSRHDAGRARRRRRRDRLRRAAAPALSSARRGARR